MSGGARVVTAAGTAWQPPSSVVASTLEMIQLPHSCSPRICAHAVVLNRRQRGEGGWSGREGRSEGGHPGARDGGEADRFLRGREREERRMGGLRLPYSPCSSRPQCSAPSARTNVRPKLYMTALRQDDGIMTILEVAV